MHKHPFFSEQRLLWQALKPDSQLTELTIENHHRYIPAQLIPVLDEFTPYFEVFCNNPLSITQLYNLPHKQPKKLNPIWLFNHSKTQFFFWPQTVLEVFFQKTLVLDLQPSRLDGENFKASPSQKFSTFLTNNFIVQTIKFSVILAIRSIIRLLWAVVTVAMGLVLAPFWQLLVRQPHPFSVKNLLVYSCLSLTIMPIIALFYGIWQIVLAIKMICKEFLIIVANFLTELISLLTIRLPTFFCHYKITVLSCAIVMAAFQYLNFSGFFAPILLSHFRLIIFLNVAFVAFAAAALIPSFRLDNLNSLMITKQTLKNSYCCTWLLHFGTAAVVGALIYYDLQFFVSPMLFGLTCCFVALTPVLIKVIAYFIVQRMQQKKSQKTLSITRDVTLYKEGLKIFLDVKNPMQKILEKVNATKYTKSKILINHHFYPSVDSSHFSESSCVSDTASVDDKQSSFTRRIERLYKAITEFSELVKFNSFPRNSSFKGQSPHFKNFIKTVAPNLTLPNLTFKGFQRSTDQAIVNMLCEKLNLLHTSLEKIDILQPTQKKSFFYVIGALIKLFKTAPTEYFDVLKFNYTQIVQRILQRARQLVRSIFQQYGLTNEAHITKGLTPLYAGELQIYVHLLKKNRKIRERKRRGNMKRTHTKKSSFSPNSF